MNSDLTKKLAAILPREDDCDRLTDADGKKLTEREYKTRKQYKLTEKAA